MAEEGVFPLPTAAARPAAGELADRLMAKIAELETKLYEKDLAENDLIAAAHGKQPSRSALPAPANEKLLTTLGDPEKQPHAAADGSKQAWLAAMPSWISRSSLAKAALESLSAADTDSGPARTAFHQRSRSGLIKSSDGSSTLQPSPTVPAWYAIAGAPAAAQSENNHSPDHLRHRTDSSIAPQSAVDATAGSKGVSPRMRSSNSSISLSVASGAAGGIKGSEPKWTSNLKHYYRYYLSSSEVDDETGDLTQRVQEAAGAALAEANERLQEAEQRLQAAQAAQQQLQQQLAAHEQLAAEVEQLKAENLEAWKLKYELEGQMASYKASLEGLQRQGSYMHKELEDMRKQSQIWSDTNSSEVQKMRAESELLTSQLAARSIELTSSRQQLTDVEAERDRALQQKQQALEERDKLQAQMQVVSALQQQLTAATASAEDAKAAATDWEKKFMKERAVRRKLHEQLQVLRGNIRVMCRVRPPLQHQQQQQSVKGILGLISSSSSCVSFPLEGLLAVHDASTARTREFEFDAVFSPETTQQQVFEEVSPLVRSCADGYNVCIFAYGQTGSGKTFTMDGPLDNPGINTRALQELFSIAAEEVDHSWSFHVAMIEIYNDTVRDLLAMAASGVRGSGLTAAAAAAAAAAHTLDVSGLPAGELPANVDRVPGLVWRKVSHTADVQAALREGARARATAATALNAASSRSHALVSVKVQRVQEGMGVTSLLHLVDLAGSERVDKSEVVGQQLKEAQAINKSLSALGDVIAALQRRGAHIPFRNSKLTQVLQDSLCGSSKVLLVCNLSPEPGSCSETVSSLNFASRAAQVELGQARRGAAAAAAAAAAAPGGSSNAAAESDGAVASEGTSGSRSIIGNSGAASPGVDRSSSPSPTKLASAAASPSTSRATAAANTPGGVRTSGSFAAGSLAQLASAAAGRPSSRLSERTAAAAAAAVASSPRVSGTMAKPARH